MQLARVYVRFYKSFNFDYEKRSKFNATRHDWEQLAEGWYPHVRMEVDPEVTAVVGANEAGKSHLLDAIECVVGERQVSRKDFCRYSQLYSIESGELRIPDVGADFIVTTAEEADALSELGISCGVNSKFLFMRPGDGDPFLLSGKEVATLDPPQVESLEQLLPRIIRFSTSIAIPDSVPISTLWGDTAGALSDRRTRNKLLDYAASVRASDANEFAPFIAGFLEFFRPELIEKAEAAAKKRKLEYELARKLLVEVARVDPQVFRELQDAISEGNEGDVSGLVGKINQSLSRHLNFSRWWSQDSDFALRVSPRERELVFTIQDRTGSEYSFRERSRGLTHFLAYFVQLKAHRRAEGRSEVLLMDEPDAYLSNSGQQDLLRVLENFAIPDDGVRSDQVVYVTHSPFLINKNAAHRIRVLDKGSQEEGTRVVKDVARTHYEPLRSSLGAYVAETAFIGGKNLIVEGVADQVLLAGMSNVLRLRGVPAERLLDLNEVTIVPAGSADSVPYIAYLARGRDPMKPPCVALLDGDEDGERAAEKLRRSEANRKPVLDQKYIVRLDDWAQKQGVEVVSSASSGKVVEIEDLIPSRVAIAAARNYASRLIGLDDDTVDRLKDADLKSRLESGGLLWDELKRLFSDKLDGERIDKVGFAREVISYIGSVEPSDARQPGVPQLEKNFSALLSYLSDLLVTAAIQESERRRSKRMGRVVRSFLDDYKEGATRSLADSRLREIEAALDDIAVHDEIRSQILAIRRDYKLRQDATMPVENFDGFRLRLESLLHVERIESQDPGPKD